MSGLLVNLGTIAVAIIGWEIGRAIYPRLKTYFAGRARVRRRLAEIRG